MDIKHSIKQIYESYKQGKFDFMNYDPKEDYYGGKFYKERNRELAKQPNVFYSLQLTVMINAVEALNPTARNYALRVTGMGTIVLTFDGTYGMEMCVHYAGKRLLNPCVFSEGVEIESWNCEDEERYYEIQSKYDEGEITAEKYEEEMDRLYESIPGQSTNYYCIHGLKEIAPIVYQKMLEWERESEDPNSMERYDFFDHNLSLGYIKRRIENCGGKIKIPYDVVVPRGF